MKYLLIVLIIALLVFAGCGKVTPNSQHDGPGSGLVENFTGTMPILPSASSLEFEGYAIVKSHIGTFDTWEGEITFTRGVITGARGTIQAASVNTGIEGLNNHLKSADFFNIEAYPEITIVSTDITAGMMTALLSFRGITKSITFPVTITENSLSSDFVFDMSDFALTYVGVDSDVRLAFTMVV
ncbi:YceI family protein [Candidatus Woesearchaeota archaeon]|nr:YceI family protein [Candidatus Woesearchaeota archaeon]